MAEDDACLITEITVFDVQIGMADAAALHTEQRFAVFQRAQLFIHDADRVILINNCSFHYESPERSQT